MLLLSNVTMQVIHPGKNSRSKRTFLCHWWLLLLVLSKAGMVVVVILSGYNSCPPCEKKNKEPQNKEPFLVI